MQLFAIGPSGQRVSAHRASSSIDYSCLDCGGTLRVRGGEQLRRHFFHSRHSSSCRSDAKSLQHLHIQLRLQERIGRDAVSLERRFPAIQRIADVCWPEEKIIFEIQCSPISLDEVLARNRDYASEGYEVFWILHDATFNTRRLSAAEHVLRKAVTYYSNVNALGEGIIYDQLERISGRRRLWSSQAFPVDPTQLHILSRHIELPAVLEKRLSAHRRYFKGDCIESYLKGSVEAKEAVCLTQIEQAHHGRWTTRARQALCWCLRLVLEGCAASPRTVSRPHDLQKPPLR